MDSVPRGRTAGCRSSRADLLRKLIEVADQQIGQANEIDDIA